MAIQDKFNKPNVIYKITKDIDLGGETLTIPEGCTIDFQGGSFSNGTIVGDTTIIKTDTNSVFNDIVIQGVWSNNEVNVDWFTNEESYKSIEAAVNLCNDNSTLVFGKGVYIVKMLKPKNNMRIQGRGDSTVLKLIDDAPLYVHPIQINNVNNVTIENLSIDGNYNRQGVDTSKYGIYIVNAKNVSVNNVSIKECSEGIMLGYSENPISEIIIKNTEITNCYRNAMALIHCENVLIENTKLIGSNESSALLDIELHKNGDYVRNVVFNNCTFEKGNNGQPIKLLSNGKSSEYGFIGFNNCSIKSNLNIQKFKNISFVNSTTKDIEIVGSSNIHINNCICEEELAVGAMVNIYGEGVSSENIFINNSIITQLGSEKTKSGVAVMSANNVFINGTTIRNFNKGISIAYDNNNINIDKSIIASNNIGLSITGNTYTGLYLGSNQFDNPINFENLSDTQTFYAASSGLNDEDGFPTFAKIKARRLRLKGTVSESTSLSGEIFEDSTTNIPHYKASNNRVYQLGEIYNAAATPPSGKPKYLGQRYLDTTYNVWYNSIYKLDVNGNNTYELKYAAETIISEGDPLVSPEYIGQKYLNKTLKKMYIGVGTVSVNDWVLFNS